ncbi:unnamed protein product [Fusarium graminearum]|nr:unnamed protein product [Fusarium graminearum]
MGEHFKIIEYPKQQQPGKLFQLLRDKLSNSGEALKLLIPNLVELYRGMGNRGSKSTVFVRKLYTVVKEQRVDGSCNGLDLQTEMVHSLFLPLKRNQVQVEKFILHLLLAYFNAGKIYKSKRGIIYYTIGSTKDLLKHVLPHFDKYPLSSLKLKDYLVFKRILLLMQKGEHQSLSGLFKIFSERANLNKGLPKVVEEEYPDLKPAVIPELKIAPTINPD